MHSRSRLPAQSLCRDARAVPAGGALEIEVARQLREFGSKETGLDQYAIAKFADALEVVPRTIAENSGGDRDTQVGLSCWTVIGPRRGMYWAKAI